MSNSNRPIKEFKAIPITAAIWRNEVEEEGRTIVRFNVKIQKRYRDRQAGEHKATDYFFPSDLPKLILVAQKAYAFVALTETEDSASEATNDG